MIVGGETSSSIHVSPHSECDAEVVPTKVTNPTVETAFPKGSIHFLLTVSVVQTVQTLTDSVKKRTIGGTEHKQSPLKVNN